MSGVTRWPRSTSRQQLIGKGRVVWLILQCLEAEPSVCAGALAQRAVGTRLWALKTRMDSRIATVRFIILGEPFKALPPHKLKHLACQPRTNNNRQFQPLMTATAYKQYKPAGCLDQAKNQLRVLPHVGRSATILRYPGASDAEVGHPAAANPDSETQEGRARAGRKSARVLQFEFQILP